MALVSVDAAPQLLPTLPTLSAQYPAAVLQGTLRSQTTLTAHPTPLICSQAILGLTRRRCLHASASALLTPAVLHCRSTSPPPLRRQRVHDHPVLTAAASPYTHPGW